MDYGLLVSMGSPDILSNASNPGVHKRVKKRFVTISVPISLNLYLPFSTIQERGKKKGKAPVATDEPLNAGNPRQTARLVLFFGC